MSAIPGNRDYRFDVQLHEGVAAQEWFRELAGGDTFEVKHDKLALKTGRVYVEFEHDPGRAGIFVPCGIARTEAACWVFVLGEPATAFIAVPTSRLVELAARPDAVLEQPHGSCPTRGAAIRLGRLLGNPALGLDERAAA